MTCTNSEERRGFTLIEVLVSITLMAMLSAAILSALRSGLLAWEKGSDHIEELRRSRVVIEILSEQIRGALPLIYTVRNDERVTTPLAFDGSRTGLRFVTRASFKDGPDAIPRWVDLRWIAGGQGRPGDLVVEERRVLPPDNRFGESVYWRGEVLRAESCFFEFLAEYQPNLPARWMQEWHYPTQQTLPRAVRMTCNSESKTIRSVLTLDYAASSIAGLTFR